MFFVPCPTCLAATGDNCISGKKHSARESRENSLTFHYGYVRSETGERVHIAAPNFQLAPFTGFNAHGAMAELIDRCAGTVHPGRPEAWQQGYDAAPKTYNRAAAIALATSGDDREFPDERGLLAQRFLQAMPFQRTDSSDFYQTAFLLDQSKYPMRDTAGFHTAQWLAAEQIAPETFRRFWDSLPRARRAPLDIGDGCVTSDELEAATRTGVGLQYTPLLREGHTPAEILMFVGEGIDDMETIRRLIVNGVPLEYARLA